HGVEDHNLRAAYLHVLADSLTSLLAIGGLVLAKRFGWMWADAAVGIVGAGVILHWTHGLLRESGRVLIDLRDPNEASESAGT
ncbi:MAG: cation transporter, partial [Myxococcota bacterium]